MAKFVLQSALMLNGADMSGDIESVPLNVQQSDLLGIQVDYDSGGSPVGSLELQGSVNYDPHLGTGTWFSLPLSVAPDFTPVTTVAIPTSPSPLFLDMYGVSVPWLKLVYTATSGSGSMTAILSSKRLGD